MKTVKLIFIFIFLVIYSFSYAQSVDIDQAEIIAKNYMFEQTNQAQGSIAFKEIITESKSGEDYYFIFNVTDNKGFVIVSAEKKYYPVIAFSDEGTFINENQPENLIWWMQQYVDQINYLRDNNILITEEINNLWNKYSIPFDDFIKNYTSNVKAVEPLAGDILWDQGNGWNAMCPEDDGGPGGHVWAGCVATAMGIVMKYWNYPIHGTGAHSYYSASYGTLSANFGDAAYFWNNMDNTVANLFSAHLLYHLGVSVNMSYGTDGSGAYSFDVDDALEDYFQYSTDANYVSKENYTQTNWINLLKGQIDNGYPVYYSGRDIDNGGHAFVCSGYNDSDLFHFNFGWSGSNNGYYTVNEVGGFYLSQAAVINIYPENSNIYPNEPNSVTAVLDNTDINTFKVDVEWTAPANKDVASYYIYRDLEQIAEVNSDVYTYTDIPEADNYYYSISAKYANNEESLTTTDFLQGLFAVTFYAVDPANGNSITQAEVSFNGEIKPTTFTGAAFSNVPYGGDYIYSISHNDFPTTSGIIDVIENNVYYIEMDGTTFIINNFEENSTLKLFPIPARNNLNLILNDSENVSKFEIVNLDGKVMQSGVVNNDKTVINVTDLKRGFYVLRIYKNDTVINKSFIKN